MSSPLEPSAAKPVRVRYFRFGRGLTRALGTLALAGLAGWFLASLCVPAPEAGVRIGVNILALASILAGLVVFLSSYSFLANAPDAMIDERQLEQRNAAYLRAYQLLGAIVLVTLLALMFVPLASALPITVETSRNFLTALFFAHLALPATVLAWRDRSHQDGTAELDD